jgi:hypothetical protein
MYQKLLSIEHVALGALTPLQPLYPNRYKRDLTCKYYAGVVGHNIHTCSAFKKKLIQLIKARWVTFKETLNVSTNPLPNHALSSGSINALETECLINCTNDKCRVRKRQDEYLRDLILKGYL